MRIGVYQSSPVFGDVKGNIEQVIKGPSSGCGGPLGTA
jgi:hypothetical protein